MSTLLKLDPGESAIQAAALILFATSLAAITALVMAQALKRRPAAAHCVLLWGMMWILSTPLLAAGFVWSGRPILFLPQFPMGMNDFFVPALKPTPQPKVAIAESVPMTAEALQQRGENRRPASGWAAPSIAARGEEGIDMITPPARPRGDANSRVNPAREAAPLSHDVAATERAASSLRTTAGVLVGFWLFGAGLLSAGIVGASIRLYWMKRSLVLLRTDSMSALLADLRRILNVATLPEICESDRVGVRCVIGTVRPAVVLPRGWGEMLNPQQLRDVLVHECAHVLRRDSIVVLLQRLATAACWPNPLVHWLNRRLADVREQVCDNYVLAQNDGISYSETLWQLARFSRYRRPTLASVGILNRRGQLEQRIAGLIDETRNTQTQLNRRAGAAIGGTLGMLCVLACGSTVRSDQPPAALQPAHATAQIEPAPKVPPAQRQHPNAPRNAAKSAPTPLEAVELVKERPHMLHVPEKVLKDRHIEFVVAKKPAHSRKLEWNGVTEFDPNRLVRIRAIFPTSQSAAEVIEIGNRVAVITEARDAWGHVIRFKENPREWRAGDPVLKGELLAAIFSGEVANKENDLVNSIKRLKIDEQIVKVAENKSNLVPELVVLNSRREVLSDRSAIDRTVGTLKSWGLTENEIQALRKEAENVDKPLGKAETSNGIERGRVEIRSPIDGVIIERNLALHEVIGDNSYNLFQIANMDQLSVRASCPEDDLSSLEFLPPALRRWTIKTARGPALQGPIDEIGSVVNPNRFVPVNGHVDNKDHKYRGGQFVTATVVVPNRPDVVEVPKDALVDDGQQAIVFVQTDPAKDYYTMRRVEITDPLDKTLLVRSRPFRQGEDRTTDEVDTGLLPKEPLRAGERLLGTGVNELKAVLLDLESRPKQ